MRFGDVAVGEAQGGILAHSLRAGGLRLKKGRVLSDADVADLAAAGVARVTLARLDAGDLPENEAAGLLARALVPDAGGAGMSVSAPFAGRVNVLAGAAGVIRVDRQAVDRFNSVDPAITLATLPDFARVRPRQMLATVKIIPYGVAGALVGRAEAGLGGAVIALHRFQSGSASLILTRTPGMKDSLLAKGAEATGARLRALGREMLRPVIVAHEAAAVAGALREAGGEMVLILGGSATSDPGDTVPQGILAAGGTIERFGMPVDPGNLLLLGRHAGREVVGLPGCARSPAINGADWVLERLAAGLQVSGGDMAAMGAGGLLKEIPLRPQPRSAGVRDAPGRARVAAVILAAGASRRMGGRDKLLEPVEGEPVLRRVARVALASRCDEVIVVLPLGSEARARAVEGLDLAVVEAPDWAEGMAASLRAGLAAVSGQAGAAVIMLADMPEVSPAHVDAVIAAFDPGEGREICRAAGADGAPGHPVLFGRRFIETLAALNGDRGARDVVREAGGFVVDVPTPGRGALVDLDTPQDWAEWRKKTGN